MKNGPQRCCGRGGYMWALPYVASNGVNSLLDGSQMCAGYIRTGGFDRVDFIGTDSDDVFAFDDT